MTFAFCHAGKSQFGFAAFQSESLHARMKLRKLCHRFVNSCAPSACFKCYLCTCKSLVHHALNCRNQLAAASDHCSSMSVTTSHAILSSSHCFWNSIILVVIWLYTWCCMLCDIGCVKDCHVLFRLLHAGTWVTNEFSAGQLVAAPSVLCNNYFQCIAC